MLDMLFSSGQKVKSAAQALDDVEELLGVVNRASEGTFPDAIKVSDESPVGDLADGLNTVLGELSSTKERLASRESQLEALDKSQAVIEFELDGTIKTANENFLAAVGYSLEEVKGQHHRIFVDPAYAASAEYRQFWKDLGSGDFKSAEYQRFKKDGSPIWIQASYNPVFDAGGKPYKVVKYASDTTAEKLRSADYEGQLGAIGKSQAVISFDLDGTIRTANENFLNAVGYTLDEVKGKHHRIFVDPAYAASAEYSQFWSDLADGDFKSGEFQRFGKNGSAIWIQASYNPIKDADGKPYKVVKYATDITAAKLQAADYEGQLDAISKSQAVIEFTMDGKITHANENFLNAVGYSLDEVKGKHHRIFVDAAYSASAKYKQFWSNLGEGEFQSGEFQRFGKGDKEIWIQASYNPIFDPDGKPYKVVKYASDITATKEMARQIEESQKIEKERADTARSQVEHILSVVQRVADGDANAEITIEGNDAIGALADGLRAFFAEKKVADQEKAQRADRERRESEETKRKVDVVLEFVNAMAEGRFDFEIPNLGQDPIGEVASALARAVDSVREALVGVRNVSNGVATASTEMSSASDEISRGAQKQAARLEETASSLEEITSTVQQNSNNAQEARALANGSRDIATDGGVVVGDAVQAMCDINESSKKISDIITTIDEIAFQTNLLALNAAVEAARAGEQGRGFAVVAAEVRNLAQRSASSAKEIKSLIQDSNAKVEKGTELVNRSGETLGEIVDSVKRVTDIVSEIAAASEEQLSAIRGVNKAVTQMDQVTQANASQTEELAGTSASVLERARSLDEMVSAFQLGQGGQTSAPTGFSGSASTPVAVALDAPASSSDEFMEF